MGFKIERNDITRVRADAIVNTANPLPLVGKGTDEAVYKAAGYENLLAERVKIGAIDCGTSAWTSAFNLSEHGVKYIIHTSGVFYKESNHEGSVDFLRKCYSSALNLAMSLKCKSVAIPLLGTGNYGFPKELGLRIAIDEISRFLFDNEIEIILVVYDDQSFKISDRLFDDVQDYLGKNLREEITVCGSRAAITGYLEEFIVAEKPSVRCNYSFDKAASSRRKKSSCLEDFLVSAETESFRDVLLKKIADRELSNAEVYKKAGLDRKYFSKIINPGQKNEKVPVKHTVMALGLALKMNLEEFEAFLKTAGYCIMTSDVYDLIVKYCVLNEIYNVIEVNILLNDNGLKSLDEK